MMADLLLQIILLPLSIFCFFWSRQNSRKWINPVSVIVVCFFIPMYLATFRLSGLQSSEWLADTYAVLWLSVGGWLLLPTLAIYAQGSIAREVVVSPLLKTSAFQYIYRCFGAVVIAAYLLSNYIQAQTLLPILVPEIAYQLHTEFPPFLRLFARCIPVVAGLSYFSYFLRRRLLDLLLLFCSLVVPLTRLSRIDVALSIVVILIVFSVFPIFRITAKRIILVILLGMGLMISAVELGNQRTNRFGLYEVSYERAIQWKPSVSGPSGALAVAYGYFPLSFENFDAFVRQSKGRTEFSGISASWFFTGLMKVNWLGGFGQDNVLGSFIPISSAANVPTALLPFYSDFGIFGTVLPGSAYIIFWLWLFYRSSRGVMWLLLFSIYTAAYSLASFQALIIAPIVFHQMVAVILIFKTAAFFQKKSNLVHQATH